MLKFSETLKRYFEAMYLLNSDMINPSQMSQNEVFPVSFKNNNFAQGIFKKKIAQDNDNPVLIKHSPLVI